MKKIKVLLAVGLTTALTAASAMMSYASEWINDSNGWWYVDYDGSYTVNGWKWIMENTDTGLAYCYYFDSNGYLLMNTTTPDGYQVNEAGIWVVDGVIQEKYLDTQEVEDYLRRLEQEKEEAKEAKIEEAKEALYEAEEESYSDKKQAVYDYFEALGFDTSGLKIDSKAGVSYSTGLMFGGGGNSMYDMLKYNSKNAINKLSQYMSEAVYWGEEGQKADRLIEAVEDYLFSR